MTFWNTKNTRKDSKACLFDKKDMSSANNVLRSRIRANMRNNVTLKY